jgi:hypothetical protein
MGIPSSKDLFWHQSSDIQTTQQFLELGQISAIQHVDFQTSLAGKNRKIMGCAEIGCCSFLSIGFVSRLFSFRLLFEVS